MRNFKRISGEAYDINKQTIYIAPKSKIESRVHYAPEPERGKYVFTARCYASAVLAMGLCLCPSVSVCHKSEFY